MNKKIVSVLFVILFLVFIGIMDYPFVARWINERKQSEVTLDYTNTVNNISEQVKKEHLEAANRYNQLLHSGVTMNLEVPFADAEIQDPTYLATLDMQSDGVMAVIDIPKINLSLPIYHGTTNESLEKGAGHLEGSSLPIGGNSTHSCIAAHRGLPSKKLFTNLDQLIEGDLFYIEVLGQKLAYEVYEIEVVTPDIVEPLRIYEGEDLVTLITCTPYGVNSHRIYVHGTRVPYDETEIPQVDLDVVWLNDWWIALTLVLLIWMCILLWWFNHKATKRA